MTKIIAEPGANRGETASCETAYTAAKLVTDHATRHLAVDIGALHARAQQRAFCSSVNRLVKLLVVKLPDYAVEIRFLDGRESAKACKRIAWDAYKILAVQITIHHDNQIGYDVAVSHAYGRHLQAYVEQTTWPHRGCDWLAGKTIVRETRPSKVMSYHARRILETPVSVYAA
jgi:hypothetical protein